MLCTMILGPYVVTAALHGAVNALPRIGAHRRITADQQAEDSETIWKLRFDRRYVSTLKVSIILTLNQLVSNGFGQASHHKTSCVVCFCCIHPINSNCSKGFVVFVFFLLFGEQSTK